MAEPAQPRLEGRTAIVTGAGSGIGRATAHALSAEGASVVANDVNPERLEATVSGLPGVPGAGAHLAVAGDISEEETSSRIVAGALEGSSRIDIVVGGVGLMFFKDIEEVTVEEFDRVMAVNVRGMFLLCKHAIPPMVDQGSGAIILVTSTSGFRGQEFDGVSSFVYNTSKAAVRQLATSLATRYGPSGIRVNAIAPGVTRTAQLADFMTSLSTEDEEEMFTAAGETTPLRRYARPEEIATAITFLASDEASYITGTTMFVDGGMTAT